MKKHVKVSLKTIFLPEFIPLRHLGGDWRRHEELCRHFRTFLQRLGPVQGQHRSLEQDRSREGQEVGCVTLSNGAGVAS